MRPRAAHRIRRTLTALFLACLLLGAASGVSARQEGAEDRFRELYGNRRDYIQISRFDLDDEKLILAYWLEDNSPLQLSVDIFRIQGEALTEPITELFSGEVAEEVQSVFAFDFTGDGRKELAFVSTSGMIKVILILQMQDDSLVEIFENGGTEITVLEPTKEVWIKSRSAEEVDIYRWSQDSQSFAWQKTLKILY